MAKLCRRGHEQTAENTSPSGGCKICRKLVDAGLVTPKEPRKFCPNGHPVNADSVALNGACLECKRQLDKQWRDRNTERKRANDKAYYEANKDDALEYSKKWADKNPDKRKAAIKKFNNKLTETLPDSYVAHAMGLPLSSVSPEIIKLKRSRMILARELKQLKNAIKGE